MNQTPNCNKYNNSLELPTSPQTLNITDNTEVSKSNWEDFTDYEQTDNQSVSQTNEQSTTYSETYFDALYNDNADPWQYQTRWYEKRKRDICLAVLPQAQYANAIELGCGNGVFSELLAQRCQALLSLDGNKHAVQLAKQRLVKLPHVKVIQGVIPNILFSLEAFFLETHPISDSILASTPPFDLIVISEILYYLPPKQIDRVIAWIEQHLAKGGTLLCCHWRYDIKGFEMNGDIVHKRLQQAFNSNNDKSNVNKQVEQNEAEAHALDQPHTKTNPVNFTHQTQMIERDFLLDVWLNTKRSLAMQENLV